MKHSFSTSLILAAAASAFAAQPLTLHYHSPASFFEEALVIGNGNIGAIIYGGVHQDRISLNDITLWTGEPDTEVFSPDAYKTIPAIRRALDNGDYRKADSLQRDIQGHYTQNYQPLGALTITYSHSDDSASAYRRSLDIANAVASRQLSIDGGSQSTEYFASAPDSVIVLHLTSEKPITATIALDSQLPFEAKAEGNQIVSNGYAAYHSYPSYVRNVDSKHLYDPERGTRFCTIVRAINNGKSGSISPLNSGQLQLADITDATLLITNATSFNGFDRNPATQGRDCATLAQKRIDRAASKDFDDLRQSHIADYKSLFAPVTLELGSTPDSVASLPTDVQLLRYTDLGEHNPDLEELYFQYGRYLLISSSRTHGVPANLQGLWNEKLLPPWSSNYTTNINVQENYWPAEVTGLGQLHEATLLPWIMNLAKTGEETAKHYYGVNKGWCLGQNSDIWASTNPVGLHSGDPVWANWNMGGAWLASHIWEHYLFTQDKEALAKYYPALKGAAEFCLNWLIEKDGQLITSPATSPENKYVNDKGYTGATMYGGAADLAMIRQCLQDAAEAAKVLGKDKNLVKQINKTLPRLAPYKIGEKGNLQEWYYDWADQDPKHRHQSHLYGLFPGRHISAKDNPELAKAAATTLEIKGDETTGWSTGWRVNLFARLLDAENAYHMYRKLLKYVSPDGYKGPGKRTGGGTYPNLLDAHAPFQIDGNFGGTAGVAEMLMQSTPTKISLLPALPAQWANGYVNNLKARGGFNVSFEWKDGKVVEASISSAIGGTTTLEMNGEERIVKLKPGEVAILQAN